MVLDDLFTNIDRNKTQEPKPKHQKTNSLFAICYLYLVIWFLRFVILQHVIEYGH